MASKQVRLDDETLELLFEYRVGFESAGDTVKRVLILLKKLEEKQKKKRNKK